MASPREDAQPDGEFLHDVQDRYQHKLQAKQAIAPLHARLPGGDDGPDVAVRQHDDKARPEYGGEARQPAIAARSLALAHAGRCFVHLRITLNLSISGWRSALPVPLPR